MKDGGVKERGEQARYRQSTKGPSLYFFSSSSNAFYVLSRIQGAEST